MLTILSILFCWPNVNAGVHFCPHCRTLHWTASRVGLARRHQQRRGQSGCLLMVNGLIWFETLLRWLGCQSGAGSTSLTWATPFSPRPRTWYQVSSYVIYHILYIILQFLSHQILAEWLSASKNALFKQSLCASRILAGTLASACVLGWCVLATCSVQLSNV